MSARLGLDKETSSPRARGAGPMRWDGSRARLGSSARLINLSRPKKHGLRARFSSTRIQALAQFEPIEVQFGIIRIKMYLYTI